MIIDRKAILSSLLVFTILGVCGYYLLSYYSNLDSSLAGDPTEPTLGGNLTSPVVDPTPGPVSEPSRDFFTEHRLEREKQRSMQVELLREIINNTNTSAEVRQQAQRDWLALTAVMEKELMIEKLIISKGFDNAVLVLNNDTAHVVIKSEGLTQAQAVNITELVASTLGMGFDKVRVIEHK